jgi:hypothetical protein
MQNKTPIPVKVINSSINQSVKSFNRVKTPNR